MQLTLALKIGVIATWLVGAAGFLFPPDSTFGLAGRLLFALLTIVHAIECMLFYSTLKRTGRPLGFEVINTMFFGVIHFTEAKTLAVADLTQTSALPLSLPFLTEHAYDTIATMGEDFWPYGLDANRHTLETFVRYMYEQGLIEQKMSVDDLFLPSTHRMFRI